MSEHRMRHAPCRQPSLATSCSQTSCKGALGNWECRYLNAAVLQSYAQTSACLCCVSIWCHWLDKLILKHIAFPEKGHQLRSLHVVATERCTPSREQKQGLAAGWTESFSVRRAWAMRETIIKEAGRGRTSSGLSHRVAGLAE